MKLKVKHVGLNVLVLDDDPKDYLDGVMDQLLCAWGEPEGAEQV